MDDHKNSFRLPRRQFLALSGNVGAAALLVGAGAGKSAAAAAHCTHDVPSSGPCPCCVAPPHANPCPTPGPLCGDPKDKDPLWNDVQYCVNGTPPPPPQPKPDCLNTTSNYVVFHGKPETKHNYLLSPTCRITGIECPFLTESQAANYWHEAWENARPGGAVPVEYDNIGLGMNSQRARHFNQMHIHMAGVQPITQTELQGYEKQRKIAATPAQWRDRQYQVTLAGSGGNRTYRALMRSNLDENLFYLLDHYVVQPLNLTMAKQTLIVVPKKAGGKFDGTFYVLNSDESLHDGTDTCDELLVYG
ncbi:MULTISPECIES: CDP-diacylglycerol diphosphatase [Streptomyces]|uniref:CDP-diacylglycerol diphosphatase n=1 Tax=Streptomyces TaxID=1883 RepID=UPI00099B2593|nr:CDP-diacylglycerol diphosphatase [Streptomyces durhamensis]